jgi:magnesium transporter
MSDKAIGTERGEPGEQLFGLDQDLVRRVDAALEAGDYSAVADDVAALHTADLADLLETLSQDDRMALIERLGTRLDPEVLADLDEVVRERVLERLDTGEIAAAISELETDAAIDVIEDLDAAGRAEVLEHLSPSDRALLEDAFSYAEDTAGRIMQREVVTVPQDWSVGDAIDYMRERATHLPRDFYDIYAVDDERHPVGVVPLSRLMRNQRETMVADILDHDLREIPVDTDQEEVAILFHRYGLISTPVVDAEGRLVGVILVVDIVDVIHEEHEEDLMRLGGVLEDDFYRAVISTTRSRFVWLLLNLGTALIASLVIGMFDAAIEKLVALAILMPVVASMGGNAGTQTLTVAVRAISKRELNTSNAMRIVGKETLVGSVNGLLFAIIAGVAAWAWFDDPALGGVIAAAMIINLFIAGFAGVAVPIVLERLSIDPAVASTVLLTTITDVVGFLSFLGLGAWLLL